MAVCKFFRQGNCKFGNNCKFEHPSELGPSQPAHQQNNLQRGPPAQHRTNAFQQGYQSNSQNQRGGPPPRDYRDSKNPKNAPYGVTRQILEEDLRHERPLWIMSAYGPGKDAAIQLFGGFPLEQSPEEIRTLHYQALAAGNPQQSAQMEAELAAKANDQTQAVLNDIDGALKYLENGSNEHPNRNDICKAGTTQLARNEHPYFSVASARYRQRNASRNQGSARPVPNTTTTMGNGNTTMPDPNSMNGFGQPMQPSPQPAAFGQAPTGGFGTPSQNAFGALSAPQNNPQFGQINPAFGQQNNNIGFGQPQPQPQPSGFGQQQSPPNGFGQPQPQPSVFGGSQHQQAPAPAPQSVPAFGAPMNQAPAPQPVAGGLFSHPQQPQALPSQPMTNGLQQPQQQQQQPQSWGFGATEQQTAANGDVQSYTTRDASNKLLTWKGRPVNYMNGQEPCYRRDDGKWERIWFPDGVPTGAASTNTGAAGALEFSENIKAAYGALKDNGQFRGGIVPEVAPSADLSSRYGEIWDAPGEK